MKSTRKLKALCRAGVKSPKQLQIMVALRWYKKRSKIDVDFAGLQKLSLRILYSPLANALALLDLSTFSVSAAGLT